MLHQVKITVFLLALAASVAMAQSGGSRGKEGEPRQRWHGDAVVFTLAPPPTPGVHARVTATVGKASASDVGEAGAFSARKVEGDLAAVARETMISHLYQKGARVESRPTGAVARGGAQDVALRDIGRGGGGASPATSTLWTYEVTVDEFVEIRLPDGSKSAGVHATLRVLDEQGTQQGEAREYFDPPKGTWRTKEEIELQIAKLIDRAKTDNIMRPFANMLSGFIGKGVQDEVNKGVDQSISEKLQEARALGLNLESDLSAANIEDYQFQEEAVRRAVEALAAKAPLPGQRAPIEVRTTFATLRKARDAYETGKVHFEAGNLGEAERVWSATPEDGARSRNLGILALRKAGEAVHTSPQEAIALADSAAEHFSKAKLKAKEDAILITAPASYRAMIEKSGAGNELPPPPPTPPITTPPTSLHALLIGIGKFKYPNYKGGDGKDRIVPPLPAAENDVTLLKARLIALGFPEQNLITLVNEKATLEGIRIAIARLVDKVDDDSLVLVSLSTHGLPPDAVFGDRGREGYVFCHDSRVESAYLSTMSFSTFASKIDDDIPCRRKIVLQDTCHSGAQFGGNPVYRMKIREYSPNFALLAACGPNQFAAERKQGNGLFTQAVESYWKGAGASKTVEELSKHLEVAVPKAAQRLGVQQKPEAFFGPGGQALRLKYK